MKLKTIYIPIEITNRELNVFLVFASEAIKRNFRILLGSKESIFFYLKNKTTKSGIFLYKGGLEKNLCELVNAKCEKHVVSDQEIGPITNDNLRNKIKNRFYDNTLNYIDHYYCADKKIYTVIKKNFKNKTKCKVLTSGWPRAEIWKNKYNKIFNEEEKYIKKKYNSFNFFSSNFLCLDLNELKIYKKKYNRIQKKRYISLKSEIKKRVSFYNEFLLFKKFLKIYDATKGIKKLVIRPHPSENINIWLELAKGFKNIYVDYKYDIHPWIINSDNILHRGCTSAFHAKISGKKVIYLKLNRKKTLQKINITHDISDYIISTAENLKNLNKFKKKISTKQNKILSYYKKTNSIKNILDDFKKFNIKKEEIIKHNLFIQVYFEVKSKYSYLKKKYLQNLYAKDKFKKLCNNEINLKLRKINKNIQSKQIIKDLISIE